MMIGTIYAAGGSDTAQLVEVAREFSPRIDVCGPREVTLDLDGLARLFGDARTIASELRRTAADRGLQVRVAIAGTRTAARLLARHRPGLSIVDSGGDAEALASLPIELLGEVAVRGRGSVCGSGSVRGSGSLDPLAASVRSGGSLDPPVSDAATELCATFRRWGLRTLGDVAALRPEDVAARLGQAGVEWQRLARGEDPMPLVPAVPEERFEQALDLEWPIEGLEPLSFVLGRLMEPLSAHLERRDRGAAVLHVRLHLVSKTIHERSLQLPTPMRDARTLRTLALLDLESHPPTAAIDRVVVAVDPTPARVLQYSLLTRPLPSPEQVSTLMARLTALMGEGRCGSPATVDSWRPGAFGMSPFNPAPEASAPGRTRPASQVGQVGRVGQIGQAAEAPAPVVVALRRFRFAVPARVQTDQGRPVSLMIDRRGLSGGRIELCAGPWRTAGQWWAEPERSGRSGRSGRSETEEKSFTRPTGVEDAGPTRPTRPDDPEGAWDRDEWDVTVTEGVTYRLFRERTANAWFIDGVLD
jgi:protein ImuB